MPTIEDSVCAVMEDIYSDPVMEDISCEVAEQVEHEIVKHDELIEHVSGYTMRIVPAQVSPTSCLGPQERGEALAAWLLSRWREQQQRQAENN